MEPQRFGMNVTLTPDAEQYVRTKLASGEYQSPDGIVNDGLRLLQQQETRRREVDARIKAGLVQIDAGQALTSEEAAKMRDERKREILVSREQ